MSLYRLYKKYKQKKLLKNLKQYIELSEECIYGLNFNIDLRNPVSGKKYLKIGNNSVVSGNFIFETGTGYISVGDRVYVGGGNFISREKIIIEDDVIIAWGCTIYDHNSHSVYWDERKNDVLQVYKDVTAGFSPIKNKDWSCVTAKEIVIKKRHG